MAVKPVGEAVFELAGQIYHISTDTLAKHSLERNSSCPLKDDADDWSVSFTADHAVGEFT